MPPNSKQQQIVPSVAFFCPSRAEGHLRLICGSAALHSLPTLGCCRGTQRKMLLPAAGALPVLPLEILKGLGLRIIYFYAGKGVFTFLDSVHHTSAMAAWTTALICSLLFLGSETGLIPWFSHLSGLPKMVQKPLLPGCKGSACAEISYSGAESQFCCSAPGFNCHPHSAASLWGTSWQHAEIRRFSAKKPLHNDLHTFNKCLEERRGWGL